jgi:hypothetical protein
MELAFAGNGPLEIAQVVGMTREAVGLIMRAPIFQHALSVMRQKSAGAMVEAEAIDTQRARTVLEQASVAAAETEVEIMSSPEVKPSVRLQAAGDILDRVLGKSAPEAAIPTVINAQTIQLLQIAVRESFAGSQAPVLDIQEG